MRRTKRRSGSDEGWKMVLERYLPHFLEFFFPNVLKDIYSERIVSVATDFQKITKDSEVGSRFADKVVRVSLRESGEKLLLIHIEVQGEPEKEFERRLFIYNYRIFDRFNEDVVTLVALTGESSIRSPFCYELNKWGFRHLFEFPSVRLMEYKTRIEELEKSTNPFAVVTLTHLRYVEAHGDDNLRLFWKKALIKSLYQRGYSSEDVINLYCFIDWVISLPDDLEQQCLEDIRIFEEGLKVAYINSAERLGIKKGMEKGIEKGRLEGKLETDIAHAKEMKALNVDREIIKKVTGIDIDTLE